MEPSSEYGPFISVYLNDHIRWNSHTIKVAYPLQNEVRRCDVGV